MNILVEFSTEDKKWVDSASNHKETIEKACNQSLEFLNLIPKNKKNTSCEISVLLTNDVQIARLNKEYRDKDTSTNVLSFPMIENFLEEVDTTDFIALGDIVLSYETILRESREQEKSFQNHLTHLVIHSMLHLLGYDHDNDKRATEMEDLEIKILKQLNIENPYKD